jgi:hypothetical protein
MKRSYAVGGLRRMAQMQTNISMDVQIAQANIDHFKKLLRIEMNERKRGVLRRLLADEELKFAAALKRQNDKKKA